MITHLLFKYLNSFKIGSLIFRKILAIIISIMLFSLLFLAVKFTKVEVPNFTRNLIMLAVVDLSAFIFIIWNLIKNEEIIPVIIKENEKSNDLKSDDLKGDGLKGDDLKSDDLKSDGLKSNDLKSNDLKSDDLKSDDLKGNDLKSDDLKGDDLKGDDLKGDEIIITKESD